MSMSHRIYLYTSLVNVEELEPLNIDESMLRIDGNEIVLLKVTVIGSI